MIKKAFEIFLSLRNGDKKKKIQDSVRISGFTNRELLFLHYAFILIKNKSIDHLNGLKSFPDIYFIDDYLWNMIQDIDKPLRLIEGELRNRKIFKTYFDIKIEDQLKEKNLNVLNTSL